jgi:hypothetical protein
LKRDPLTQEEIVSFTLVPRLTSGGKLGPLQRAIIEIIASRRKNAVKDGLVETFAMLTCLPQTTPVAISFTASVNQGRTNALVVAGKNLQNTRLRMAQGKEWLGISLEHQFSDDNIALALVSVDDTATVGKFAIELVSDSGSDQPTEQTLNLLPQSLEVTIQRPGNTPGTGNDGSLARLIDDDDDRQAGVDISPLSAAPAQVALAPTKTDSIAYSLSAAPDAPPSFSEAPATFSGVPDTNSSNLVFGARFDALELDFEFPLFAYARLVPIFNRGGKDVTDRGVVARLGTVTALRNQTLLLVLDGRLSIHIKVTVFIGVNPFNDIDSPQKFLDPFPTKALPDNAFGVVIEVFVSTRVSLAASLFVGLLAPDPVTRALTVRPGYRDIRIEPQNITVLPGAQQVVKAFGIPINEDGSDASGEEKLIPTDEVTFQPTEFIAQPDGSFEDAQGVFTVAKVANVWQVTGLKEGARGLRAFVSTSGAGNASDKTLNTTLLSEIAKLLAQYGVQPGAYIYIADAALVTEANLAALADTLCIIRLPATYSACERVRAEAVARNQWEEVGVLAQTPPTKHRPGTC